MKKCVFWKADQVPLAIINSGSLHAENFRSQFTRSEDRVSVFFTRLYLIMLRLYTLTIMNTSHIDLDVGAPHFFLSDPRSALQLHLSTPSAILTTQSPTSLPFRLVRTSKANIVITPLRTPIRGPTRTYVRVAEITNTDHSGSCFGPICAVEIVLIAGSRD